jgi:hypothetical protein
MQELMTKDAALALGISQRQITDLLRAGKLGGEQLQDGTWLVSRRALGERRTIHAGSGRAWSASSSWALLGELSGRATEGLSQSTQARIRRRIRDSSVDEIARKVATRTSVHRYVADSLSRTAADLTLTGASAADVVDRTLTSETRRVEGDVTIYEAPESEVFGRRASDATIAADLARSVSTRERSAGLAILENMRQAWLARHTP